MHPDNALHASESNVSAAAQMRMLHQAQDESAAASAAAATATAAATAALTDDEPLTETESIKQATPRKVQGIDIDSISMFPSLGSSSARPAVNATWGAARVKSAAGNLGAVGDQRRSPAVAPPAAAAAAASGWGAPPPRSSTSGNTQERVQIPAAQIPTFGNGKVGDVVKTVMSASGARIETSTSQATGLTTFLISGKPEAVTKARLHLRSSFAKKVKTRVLMDRTLDTGRVIVVERGNWFQNEKGESKSCSRVSDLKEFGLVAEKLGREVSAPIAHTLILSPVRMAGILGNYQVPCPDICPPPYPRLKGPYSPKHSDQDWRI